MTLQQPDDTEPWPSPLQSTSDKADCVVCYSASVNKKKPVCLFPCGHTTVCIKCVTIIKKALPINMVQSAEQKLHHSWLTWIFSFFWFNMLMLVIRVWAPIIQISVEIKSLIKYRNKLFRYSWNLPVNFETNLLPRTYFQLWFIILKHDPVYQLTFSKRTYYHVRISNYVLCYSHTVLSICQKFRNELISTYVFPTMFYAISTRSCFQANVQMGN